MAEFTAKDIAALRKQTGAGMLDCRTALEEANGDLEAAKDWLRTQGLAGAAKRAGRAAQDGAVDVLVEGATGAVVELNCETDFVAKTGDFQQFAGSLAELVAKRNPVDLAALNALPLGGATVEEARKALFGRVRENISIRRFARIEARGRLSRYVHGEAKKIGVLVDLSGGNEQLGRDLAMHIAASKPLGLSRDDLPAELLKKERDIAAAKAAESGKPANIAEKMVEGSVQKFVREVTLLGQVFVKDPAGKQTVEALLKAGGASVSRFVLYVVGEGIEKKGNGQAD